VQSTGVDAQNELVRQFMAQWKKDGLIIDERWNSGGQIPDRFIELLNRPIAVVLGGSRRPQPAVAARLASRAAVMLINGWSGSGGDAFPFYFREAGLRPLIGTRTWGGLIGISGCTALADGGGRHGADLPDVSTRRGRGSPRATASNPTSPSRGSLRARERHRPAARARDQGSDGSGREAASHADTAGVRKESARGQQGLTWRNWRPCAIPRSARSAESAQQENAGRTAPAGVRSTAEDPLGI
jgi:hypothetical protein